MAVKRLVKRIAASSLSFAALDAVWLGAAMKDFYRQQLGGIARGAGNAIEPDWTAAVLVYALLVAGVNIFAVGGASGPGAVSRSAFRGALFGLIAYGIYDLTNMAIIEGWTWKLTIVDILWGAFLCAAVSAVTARVE